VEPDHGDHAEGEDYIQATGGRVVDLSKFSGAGYVYGAGEVERSRKTIGLCG
jgi:hypothetical protein